MAIVREGRGNDNIGRIHFRMCIYHVGFSSPMLGFEDGKAMEEMHVVMREESRVESCALLGLWVWPTRLPGNAHPCQIGE